MGDPYTNSQNATVPFALEHSIGDNAEMLQSFLKDLTGITKWPSPSQLAEHIRQVLGYDFPRLGDDEHCLVVQREFKYKQDFSGVTNRAAYMVNVSASPQPDGSLKGTATSTGQGWGHSPAGWIEYGSDGSFEVTGARNGDNIELTLKGIVNYWATYGPAGPWNCETRWTIKVGPLQDGYWEDVEIQAPAFSDTSASGCGDAGTAPGSSLKITTVAEEKHLPRGSADGASPTSGSVAASQAGGNTVPALVSALSDRSIFRRRRAAETLSKFGPAAAPAIESLIQATTSNDHELQRLAALALGEIGPDAKSATAGIKRILTHEEPTVRVAAALALWKITGLSRESLDVLSESLSSKNVFAVVSAASALGLFGPVAKPLAGDLRQLMKKKNPGRVRVNAAISLWRIDRDFNAVVPVLKDLLKDKRPTTRNVAAKALDEIERNRRR